jgi:hypothetical protein
MPLGKCTGTQTRRELPYTSGKRTDKKNEESTSIYGKHTGRQDGRREAP